MGFCRFLVVLLLICAVTADLFAQRRRKGKQEEEEITQTLEVLQDPPPVVTADPQKLIFLNAPLSSKGLLSQQVRDGLKALRRLARGGQLIKVRAFVAGTGDVRRVQSILSETFTEDRLPLPALTVVRVGGLPYAGTQVVLEGIATTKKAVNPNGLAFFSGQQVSAEQVLEKVAPLLKQSIERLETALRAVPVNPQDVLRVTCFVSALGDYAEQRQHVASRFPQAAITIVQTLRGLSPGLSECEAVGRLATPPNAPIEPRNPQGLAPSANYSHVMLVHAPKIVLSGGQLAFNSRDEDVRLAFDRLQKSLEQAGGSLRTVAMANYYPLSGSMIEKIRRLRFEFLDKTRPPASTMLLFEGLPSLDATFAMEVVALP